MSVFNSMYGIVDGLYVANYAGKSALAAVNFAFPILLVMSAFGYMFGAGGNALVGKTLGEQEKEKANELGLKLTDDQIRTILEDAYTTMMHEMNNTN